MSNKIKITVCLRCAELHNAAFLSANEYIRFICDLLTLEHTCSEEVQ